MSIVTVKAQSYQHSLELLRDEIYSRQVDLSCRHLCFVPDDLTLLAEKMLFSKKGAFDVEVLTFNRMLLKENNSTEYLPRHGAIMLLRSIVKRLEKELKFFSLSVSFKGFSKKLYETISMLSGCKISPSDLSTLAQTSAKIHDIKLIYENYLNACSSKYVDSLGRGELLYKNALTKTYENTSFYFAGFCSFSKQQQKIIEAFSKTAKRVVIFEPSQTEYKFNDVELYVASSSADQLKATATRMRALKIGGVPYGKIGIISPSLQYEQAKRILTEFEIPFNLEKKVLLAESAVACFLELLAKVKASNCLREDVLALSKNYFACIDKKSADVFENYCNKFCIDRKYFFEQLSINDNDNPLARSVAEDVRKKIVRLINSFSNGLRDVDCATSFHTFLKDFFAKNNVLERNVELSKLAFKPQNARSVELVLQTSQMLSNIFGDIKLKQEEIFETFFEGLNSVAISAVPYLNDAVQIGTPSSFRAGGYDYIFVVGFCEGEIPPVIYDTQVLSDLDLETINSFNLSAEPSSKQLNINAVNDFLSSISTAKKVFLAYSDSDDKRVSVLRDEICRNASSVLISSHMDEELFLSEFNPNLSRKDDTDFERIALLCASKGNALELLLKSISRSQLGANALSFQAELFETVGLKTVERYLDWAKMEREILLNPKGLFFKGGSVNVTDIQNFFACPYSHFLSSGIRLSQKPDGKLSPIDIGKILHSAVENFVRKNDFERPADSMNIIIDTILGSIDKARIEQNRAIIEHIRTEAVKLADIIASQINVGEFKPLWLERVFFDGENDSLRSIKVPLNDGSIFIKGIIDRVDIFENFVRVIDYKSGSVSKSGLNFTDLYFGKKIQLLLYLAILNENGFKSAGAFYFPLRTEWDDDEFSQRLSGVYNCEPSVLRAFDRGLCEPSYKSFVINAKTRKASATEGVEFAKSDYSFLEGDLNTLASYAVEVLKNATREIEDGMIKATPIDNTCEYCIYKPVCGKDESNPLRRERQTVTSAEILNLMKESDDIYGE